jgi:hypothetical protein
LGLIVFPLIGMMEYWNVGYQGVGSLSKTCLLFMSRKIPNNQQSHFYRTHSSIIPLFPPGRRPYPPAWKLYGLEAGPEANDERSELSL